MISPKCAVILPLVRFLTLQAFLRNLEAATRLFLRDEALELENDSGIVMVFAPWEGSE